MLLPRTVALIPLTAVQALLATLPNCTPLPAPELLDDARDNAPLGRRPMVLPSISRLVTLFCATSTPLVPPVIDRDLICTPSLAPTDSTGALSAAKAPPFCAISSSGLGTASRVPAELPVPTVRVEKASPVT